jgi:hypothetical protein
MAAKGGLYLVVARTRYASNVSFESTSSAYFDIAAALILPDTDRVQSWGRQSCLSCLYPLQFPSGAT